MELNKLLLRIIAFALAFTIIIVFPLNVYAGAPFDINAKSALLMDYDTGTILYEKNIHEKLPIASITKIMTILLIMEALEAGRIDLEEEVTVSEYAASMGGSQVFLSPGEKLPVSAMLKSIIVASANDASIAMAEKISGTHEAFVKKMNERAAELGMKNTNFVNCTGLPAENHYSTAYDVSLMSRELLKHSYFLNWSTIWLDYLKESENNTQLANTNRLVRFYDGCDGIKTGSTSEALYCLSATAKRGNLRLISVILAAPTSNVRFAESTKLLDYGFANYDSVPIIKKDQVVEKEIAIAGGKERIIEGIAAQDFSILQGKEESKSFEIKTEIQSNIKAPIAKGQKIGTLTIEKDGKVVGTIDILSDREVKSANIYDYFKDIINQWIQKLE